MKYLLFILPLLVCSCKKEEVTPIDPVIAKFTQELTGTWNAVTTQCGYNASNNNYTVVALNGSIDCATEQQWDYVKKMTITADLKVTNEYYCSPLRATRFELKKEKSDSTIVITEWDVDGNMIKVYTVLTNTPSTNELWLYSEVFDPAYFYRNKPGSFPTLPVNYFVLIQKQ